MVQRKEYIVPPDVIWVGQPAYRRDTKRWQVPWKDKQRGAHCPGRFKTLEDAKAFSDACAVIVAANLDKSNFSIGFRSYDNTSSWWVEYQAEVAHRLGHCGPGEEFNHYKALLGALSNAGRGVKPFIDNSLMEERVTEVESRLKEIRTKRKDAAGTRGETVKFTKTA